MSECSPTTAQYLGTFRSELIEQGFSEKEAFVLSRDALSEIARNDGVCVRVAEVAA